MYHDELITTWLGDRAVKVTRTTDNPATTDYLRIVFSDGSRLFMHLEVDAPLEAMSVGETVDLSNESTARRFFNKVIERLYTRATFKDLDVDI